MPDYILKFYRRPEGAIASKVVAREPLNAADQTSAIESAKALWAARYDEYDFAMLFVAGSDLIWVSEKSTTLGVDSAASQGSKVMEDDPDRWIALGRDLRHFRRGGPEAELFYAAHPELREYVWRWWRMVTHVDYRAFVIRDVAPSTEEDLREMWLAVRWKTVP